MAYFVLRQKAPSILQGGSSFWINPVPSFHLEILSWGSSAWVSEDQRGLEKLTASAVPRGFFYFLSPYLVLPENREGERRPCHFHRDNNCSFPAWIRKGKMPNAGLRGDQNSNQVQNKWQRPLFDWPPKSGWNCVTPDWAQWLEKTRSQRPRAKVGASWSQPSLAKD